MGILERASSASVWRGYDCYMEKRVLSIQELESDVYAAAIAGNRVHPYTAELHVCHPRKSKCNCPHANGKRIVCKHIVAVYFSLFPAEAEKFYAQAIAYAEEEEKREEERFENMCAYVYKMKKNELQQALLQLLADGPAWQYEHFAEEHFL